MGWGQSNHRMQVNIQRRIYGHDTNVAIHPLNEDKAVQDASDLLGEFIIFGVKMMKTFCLSCCPQSLNL
jgi:hypothetical protein